jgi:hypothetical protein
MLLYSRSCLCLLHRKHRCNIPQPEKLYFVVCYESYKMVDTAAAVWPGLLHR